MRNKRVLFVVDTHTRGELNRIVLGGLPNSRSVTIARTLLMRSLHASLPTNHQRTQQYQSDAFQYG